MRRALKINPIDQDVNSKVGISLPFNGSSVFNSTITSSQQLKSNLLNLLLTEKGEKLFDVEFGVGLRRLLFENVTDTEFLKQLIIKEIEKYLPTLIIQEFRVDIQESNQIDIYLKYASETDLRSDDMTLIFN